MINPYLRLARFPLLAAGAFAVMLSGKAAFATDGYFDPAWAGGGFMTFVTDNLHPADDSRLLNMFARADGKIVLGGGHSASNWWLGELDIGGSFAPTFGVGGSGRVTQCQIAPSCNVGWDFRSMAPAPGNKYEVLGNLVARTTADANGYDGAGNYYTTLNNVQGLFTLPDAIAVLPSGETLVSGAAHYSMANSTPRFGLVRLDSNLALDVTFNASTDINNVTFAGGAVVAVDPNATSEEASDVFVLPDSRILLVGSSSNGSTRSLALARLDASGALDPTFGNGGTALINLMGHSIVYTRAAVDRAGRAVVVMNDSQNSGILIARVNASGTLDFFTVVAPPSYAAVPCSWAVSSAAAAIDSAGRILVTGFCGLSNPYREYFLVVRLRGDTGVLDQSFGISGTSVGLFDPNLEHSTGTAIVIDASGHPVVGGISGITTFRPGVARLTYDLIYTDGAESTPRGCLPPGCG